MISSHVRNDIDRLIAGGLSAVRHRKLRDHIRGCGDCAQYYEEQRAVEDALFASAGMAPSAVERMQELVLGDVESAKRRWPSLSALAVVAAAAVALLLWVRGPSDEFASRGGAAAPPMAGVLLFAIDPATKSARHVSDGDHLARGTIVALAYSNSDFDYGAVLAIDGQGTITWLSEQKLARDARQEPLPGSWTLSDTPTTVRLLAVFSRSPVDHARVEKAVTQGSRRLDAGDAEAQDSLEVHID